MAYRGLITVSYLNTCSVEFWEDVYTCLYLNKMSYRDKDKCGIIWKSPTSLSSFLENNTLQVQNLGIYAVYSHLNHCNSFSHNCAILVEGIEKKSENRQLAHFSNLPMWYLSNAFQPILLLMEAYDNHVNAIVFSEPWAIPTYGILYAITRVAVPNRNRILFRCVYILSAPLSLTHCSAKLLLRVELICTM